MKHKWWILFAVPVAALLIGLCFFGVRLRIAPRLVLSRAIDNSLAQLDSRFEKSPVQLLAKALDSQGRQRAALKLETESKHLGPVVYDMTLQTQTGPNRIKAEGAVITGGKVLDIQLFLDENFAALASQGLLEGRYYGITYETFSRDLRERQLLTALLGEGTIADWEENLLSLGEKMSTQLTFPEFSAADIRNLFRGVLALKPEIGREKILLPTAGDHRGFGVTFRATGAEIHKTAEPYRQQLSGTFRNWIDKMSRDPESQVCVKFSLYEGKLIQILAQLDIDGEASECLIYLGDDPGETTLSVEWNEQTGGESQGFSVMIRTEQDEERYEEELHFTKTGNGKKESTTVEYTWDLSSCEMALDIRQGERTVQQRLNLTGEGESLTIRSQNIRPLLNFLLEQEKVKPAICTLTVSPGGSVPVPEYRNLDQWSAEDLLALLTGFGGLLGLNMR